MGSNVKLCGERSKSRSHAGLDDATEGKIYASEIVRMAIMQRKNAEDALASIKSANVELTGAEPNGGASIPQSGRG